MLFKSVSELKSSRSCTIFSYVHVWFCNSCFNFLLHLSNALSQSQDILVLDIHFECWLKPYLKPNCCNLGESKYFVGDCLFECFAFPSSKNQPLKKLKGYGLFKQTISLQIFKSCLPWCSGLWYSGHSWECRGFFTNALQFFKLIILISYLLDNSPGQDIKCLR